MQTPFDIMTRGADMGSHKDFLLVRINESGFDCDQNGYITYTSQDEMIDELFVDGEWLPAVMEIVRLDHANGIIMQIDLDDWAREINAETIANDNHNRSLRGPQ